MIVSDLYKDETTKYITDTECDTKYVLKSEYEKLVAKIDGYK